MEERYIALAAIFGATLLVIFWASLIIWVYRDIRDRARDLSLQVISVFLVMAFPLLGLLLYLILRPRETLEEAYARSLEEEALLREIGEDSACPSCRRFVEKDFLHCPHCRSQLREPCAGCGRPLSFSWIACPTCGSDRPTPGQARLAALAQGAGVRGGRRQTEAGGVTTPEAAEAGREGSGIGP